MKAVRGMNSGEANGWQWTMSRVVDTDNTSFTLFVGSRYTMSMGDAMDDEVAQNSEDVNRTILGPMECYNPPIMMMAGFPHGGTL